METPPEISLMGFGIALQPLALIELEAIFIVALCTVTSHSYDT
jgi:hypothetical protein